MLFCIFILQIGNHGFVDAFDLTEVEFHLAQSFDLQQLFLTLLQGVFVLPAERLHFQQHLSILFAGEAEADLSTRVELFLVLLLQTLDGLHRVFVGENDSQQILQSGVDGGESLVLPFGFELGAGGVDRGREVFTDQQLCFLHQRRLFLLQAADGLLLARYFPLLEFQFVFGSRRK